MNAFELLKKDHRKVDELFKQLEPTTERAVKTREELFTKLKQELDIHAHIEETILYPVLKRERETREITFEGYEEHAVVKDLLKQLDATPVDSEEWTAKLKVLKENVEHHVEEEEGEMFPDAEKALSEDEINAIGDRLDAEKQKQQQALSAGA